MAFLALYTPAWGGMRGKPASIKWQLALAMLAAKRLPVRTPEKLMALESKWKMR
jgi:hypothetical protein